VVLQDEMSRDILAARANSSAAALEQMEARCRHAEGRVVELQQALAEESARREEVALTLKMHFDKELNELQASTRRDMASLQQDTAASLGRMQAAEEPSPMLDQALQQAEEERESRVWLQAQKRQLEDELHIANARVAQLEALAAHQGLRSDQGGHFTPFGNRMFSPEAHGSPGADAPSSLGSPAPHVMPSSLGSPAGGLTEAAWRRFQEEATLEMRGLAMDMRYELDMLVQDVSFAARANRINFPIAPPSPSGAALQPFVPVKSVGSPPHSSPHWRPSP